MRMEQYLTHTDFALWEVILNGDAPTIASASAGTEGPIPPKTAEQKLARKKELKAKSTLFGGNKESKKMQKTILKQQYENFAASRSEGLDKTYDSTNEAVSTAHEVSTASSQGQAFSLTYADDVMFSFFAKQSNSPQLDNEDFEQIYTNDLEEMNLKCDVGEQGINVVNSSACWIWRLKGNVIDYISKDNGSCMPKRFDYGNPQYALQHQGIFYSGCSRHMTGNKFYLSDYQDINGGFIAFRGSSKGGKNYWKSVLFTETEYLVLSSDFKLLDESQVFFKIPRQNSMYSFDLKNVVPLVDLTCLFAKATIDESNLWHRRLSHINFKTINKLVRGNLVRGLPSKLFENNHTCVACQKGKQHKASCKTKTVSSICKPLQLLHMDLFGPVSMRSINRKSYCLVVTDDFNHKVITIRSDNGGEFKNRIMNEFCEMKGRKPALNFMRPFGCPVTILNTLDHLGTGPNWMFDIDTLSMSQNPKSSEYEIADDAGKKNGVKDPAKEDDINGPGEATNTNITNRLNTVSSPVNTLSSSFIIVDPVRARDQRNEFKSVFGQDKDANSTYRMFTPVSAVESSYENLGGSTSVNAATSSNADYPIYPLMPDLEDTADLQDTGIFGNAYDDEDVGAKADLNNLETTMSVRPIPTTRIHKDHPKEQIIRDINCNTPKLGRSGIRVRGVLLQDQQHKIYKNDTKSRLK
ncbi:ribonuclease H-like domain-containing protein [Tanacetum coccineum]